MPSKGDPCRAASTAGLRPWHVDHYGVAAADAVTADHVVLIGLMTSATLLCGLIASPGVSWGTRPDGSIARIEGLEQVSCPVLILHPSGDRIFSREHAKRFLPEVPNAELRELPDCGHTPMIDHPELVAAEILQFTAASG